MLHDDHVTDSDSSLSKSWHILIRVCKGSRGRDLDAAFTFLRYKLLHRCSDCCKRLVKLARHTQTHTRTRTHTNKRVHGVCVTVCITSITSRSMTAHPRHDASLHLNS